MKYNIEKINQIGEMLAEVIEEAVKQTEAESVRIGNIEMALRENLLAIGKIALKQILENADGKLEAEIECACGGKLKYQRRHAATIWSVFGKVVYKRAYYAGCTCRNGCAPVDRHYGIEPGKVTAGLAHLIALSGLIFPCKKHHNKLLGLTHWNRKARKNCVFVCNPARVDIMAMRSNLAPARLLP